MQNGLVCTRYNVFHIIYACTCAFIYIQGSHKGAVAVKCIERKCLTSSSMENLLTEIKVMKQLDHEYIVKLIEFEVSTSVSWLSWCGCIHAFV